MESYVYLFIEDKSRKCLRNFLDKTVGREKYVITQRVFDRFLAPKFTKVSSGENRTAGVLFRHEADAAQIKMLLQGVSQVGPDGDLIISRERRVALTDRVLTSGFPLLPWEGSDQTARRIRAARSRNMLASSIRQINLDYQRLAAGGAQ